jgi:hypothetical protein
VRPCFYSGDVMHVKLAIAIVVLWWLLQVALFAVSGYVG